MPAQASIAILSPSLILKRRLKAEPGASLRRVD